MQLLQEFWTRGSSPRQAGASGRCRAPQLVLAFAAPVLLAEREMWQKLRACWPAATIVACSTAGEICGTRVLEETMVVTAVEFERTSVRSASVALNAAGNSARAGETLAQQLNGPELSHVFVLSDGLNVNGTELVRGLCGALPESVALSGGLAGDGDRFERTYCSLDGNLDAPHVLAIGFYGAALRVGCGSQGGWDPFGPERRVTRSRANVLYELDGRPALDLYEEYLGEYASGLPASGLLFPLTVRGHREEPGLVRTILSTDAKARSLTFAGDVPQGHYARLMRANVDRLLDGAAGAAEKSRAALGSTSPELAVLISCVGRKLVLGQRVEEEVESVRRVLGRDPVLTGFYSYGEISPGTPAARCELHNQTMTITTFAEELSA